MVVLGISRTNKKSNFAKNRKSRLLQWYSILIDNSEGDKTFVLPDFGNIMFQEMPFVGL